MSSPQVCSGLLLRSAVIVLLAATAVGLRSPADAQTAPSSQTSARAPGVISGVDVHTIPEAIEIQINLTRMVSPKVFRLTGPDRVVLDFPNVLPANGNMRRTVNAGGVRSVRMALFDAKAPVARIVIDTDQKQPLGFMWRGNRLVVKVSPAGLPTAARVAPKQLGPLVPAIPPVGKASVGRVRKTDQSPRRIDSAAFSGSTWTIQYMVVTGAPPNLVVSGSGAASARTMVLTAPDRIVLDFPRALPGHIPANISVTDRAIIRQVRTALYRASPPTTRIVVDLSRACTFKVSRGPGQLTLSFNPVISAFSRASVPPTPVANASRPPVSPSSAPIGGALRRPAAPPIAAATALPLLVAPSVPGATPTVALPSVPDLKTPLEMQYVNGLLTVTAKDCSLGEILLKMRTLLDANIEMPPEIYAERVYGSYGPAPPEEVVRRLFAGSDFNFVLLGTNSDSAARLHLVISKGSAEESNWEETRPATTAAPNPVRTRPIQRRRTAAPPPPRPPI